MAQQAAACAQQTWLAKAQGEHVATVGGDRSRQTSLGRLCYHLAELAEVVHIQLAARLVPGPAHPELIKAAAQPEGHKMPKLHAEVDILLMEEAVLIGGEGLQELTEGKKKGRKSRGGTSGGKRDNTAHSWTATARHMAPVLNWLMLADSGLQVGPDCDGLLNFCDEEPSSSSSRVLDGSAAEGSRDSNGPEAARAQQGLSDGIADGQQGTADGQLGTADGQQGTADGQLGTTEGQLDAGPGVSSVERAPMTVQQMLDSVALPDELPWHQSACALYPSSSSCKGCTGCWLGSAKGMLWAGNQPSFSKHWASVIETFRPYAAVLLSI